MLKALDTSLKATCFIKQLSPTSNDVDTVSFDRKAACVQEAFHTCELELEDGIVIIPPNLVQWFAIGMCGREGKELVFTSLSTA